MKSEVVLFHSHWTWDGGFVTDGVVKAEGAVVAVAKENGITW